VSPAAYAAKINRNPRTVQYWCSAGLIGKRIGGRWEIEEGTPPPVIVPKRKVGRIKQGNRQDVFKRRTVEA
jgi:hypothetical protein